MKFKKILGIVKKIFVLIPLLLIRIYQYTISPFLGASCRFYPSCSEYGAEALKKFGLFKGIFLIVRRIGKCHPWHRGGYDPLP